MPDPIQILEAQAAAAVLAAAVFLCCAWPWRTPRATRTCIGGVLGTAMGFFAGCWWLGLLPRWPPREDLDRLLLLLLPALVVVEMVAASLKRHEWLAWPLRLLVAAGAAPVLLYNSSYLAELSGPGSREWTPAQTWLTLGGLASALAAVWAALVLLAQRSPGRSLPWAVAVAVGGAAVTVMLSGYATGGQTGLPLAAALAGAMLASLALSEAPDVRGVLGLGIVGLFGLLVIGRFFGQLATIHAVLLFFAPLLAWLPELLYLRRMGPRLGGLARVIVTALPVAIAVILAQQQFVADSNRPSSPDAREPSLQDYLDFGK